jgi:branched-subunit amino acid ABC-type transport system permease component
VSATILATSAVAGIATDQGYTDAFVVSAVIAACAAVVALFIPRAPESVPAPTLQEFGAASPLGEPAFSAEDS